MVDNYYKILGVSVDANQEDIKLAYRQLARKYHPDVSTEPNAEQQFKQVKQAYDTLKNPEKRLRYNKSLVTPVEYNRLQQFLIKLRTARAVARARKRVLNQVNLTPWWRTKFSLLFLILFIVSTSVFFINKSIQTIEKKEITLTASPQSKPIELSTDSKPINSQLPRKIEEFLIVRFFERNYREILNSFPIFYRKTIAYLTENYRFKYRRLVQIVTAPEQTTLSTGLITTEFYSPNTIENQIQIATLPGENGNQQGKFLNTVKKVIHNLTNRDNQRTIAISLREKHISDLLITCQQRLQEQQLFDGKQGNAYDCYRQVLRQKPKQADALAGLKTIEKRYVTWAQQALQNSEMDKFNHFLHRLAQINPQSADLKKLKRAVQSQVVPKKQVELKKRVPKEMPAEKTPKITTFSQPPSTQEAKVTCQDCSCSDIFKQLSLGVKPLNMRQRYFFDTQCR